MIHKPCCEFGTETMLNTNEPATHLSHKSRYIFATQTMMKKNEQEVHFFPINHAINLSHKPC